MSMVVQERFERFLAHSITLTLLKTGVHGK